MKLSGSKSVDELRMKGSEFDKIMREALSVLPQTSEKLSESKRPKAKLARRKRR